MGKGDAALFQGLGRRQRAIRGKELRPLFQTKGRAEHGQLQVPRGELLGRECVALGGGERRVGFFVARGEKLAHRSGVEGDIEARA